MNLLRRRDVLRLTTASLLGAGVSPWFSRLAAVRGDEVAQKKRSCILLWMAGGPSQFETWDPKPEHANGGDIGAIETNVPGMRFSSLLPELAKRGDKLAIARGMNTREGDHDRGTYLMHIGRAPGGPVRYPSLGAYLSKALGSEDSDLPSFVTVTPAVGLSPAAFGPGFLGPRYAPLQVAASGGPVPEGADAPNPAATPRLRVEDLLPDGSVPLDRREKRLALLDSMQQSFAEQYAQEAALAQRTIVDKAIRLMRSSASDAFDISKEPEAARERYGSSLFGQGCLMARRLVETGVPFIEVAHGGGGLGWDTHVQQKPALEPLCGDLDRGWSALLDDLADRGLLETTTIVWMGEFGRTPKINDMAGRDHFPDAWSVALAGAGIKTGQVYGKTSDDGTTVVDGQMNAADLHSTLCTALGIDPGLENDSEDGRPIKLAEGKVVTELLA